MSVGGKLKPFRYREATKREKWSQDHTFYAKSRAEADKNAEAWAKRLGVTVEFVGEGVIHAPRPDAETAMGRRASRNVPLKGLPGSEPVKKAEAPQAVKDALGGVGGEYDQEEDEE